MIKKLFGLIFLICIIIGVCFFLFNVKTNTFGYDILATDKKSGKLNIGLRYKEEFMIHIFKVKSVGDNVGEMVDKWRTQADSE